MIELALGLSESTDNPGAPAFYRWSNAANTYVSTHYAPGALQVIQDDGNLVRLANILTPLDRQSVLKITNTRIPNVYQTLAKGSIPTQAQSLNTSGQTIFCELNATALKSGGASDVYLPVAARLELRLPNDGELDNQFVLSLVNALLAGVADSDTGRIRITDIMRGVLFRES